MGCSEKVTVEDLGSMRSPWDTSCRTICSKREVRMQNVSMLGVLV